MLYILINIFVSAVGFGRSFVFMRWLDNDQLGIISLVQTVVLFLGLFQLGLLNGGYRIFALGEIEQQREINNILFTYFGVLASIGLAFWLCLVLSGTQIIISNDLMLLAIVCGMLTLTMNWLTNTLIGKGLIKDINKINLTSSLISLASLPLILAFGTVGAVVILIIQPVIFVACALFLHPNLRPNKLNFDLKLVKYILSFGFIPFLAGIFVLINMQIERWSIANILGTAPLGEFYLVFLYATLFVLIPSSLLNIFFPKAIYAYEHSEIVRFKSIIKKHLILLGIYLLSVVLMTVFVMQPFIDWLLPMHSSNTQYVYYFLPGLIFLVLCDPIAIVLNSVVRLKPMLYAGLVAIIMNVALITLVEHLGQFNLTNMAIIKSIINSLLFFIYLVYVLVNRKFIFRARQ